MKHKKKFIAASNSICRFWSCIRIRLYIQKNGARQRKQVMRYWELKTFRNMPKKLKLMSRFKAFRMVYTIWCFQTNLYVNRFISSCFNGSTAKDYNAGKQER